MNLRRTVRGPITWLIVAVVVVLALLTFTSGSTSYKNVSLSSIENAIQAGQVKSATLKDKEQQIQVTLNEGTEIDKASKVESAYTANYDVTLMQELTKAEVKTRKVSVTHENVLLSFVFSLIPFALILLVMFFILNQMQGGGGRVMQFGKAKAKLVSKDTPKTTFADVAGGGEGGGEGPGVKEVLGEPGQVQA